jgi:7-cyano-7-deazaguanine reductase
MNRDDYDLPLGKPTRYVTTYTPSLLRSIPRADARTELATGAELPFVGEDVWTCYEFSWLNPRGRPEVAVVRIQVPCQSTHMAESKSLKLYLNSFAQTQFESRAAVARTLDSDLRIAFRAPVLVALLGVDQMAPPVALPGRCIDHLDVAIEHYEPDAALLERDAPATVSVVRETLHTHLLRSVCPVTGQPDWASLLIEYAGAPISHASLLRYVISYRLHAAFHESTIERIFVDVLRRCEPDRLSVHGRFLRRGGIDINPFRSTHEAQAPPLRVLRQ